MRLPSKPIRPNINMAASRKVISSQSIKSAENLRNGKPLKFLPTDGCYKSISDADEGYFMEFIVNEADALDNAESHWANQATEIWGGTFIASVGITGIIGVVSWLTAFPMLNFITPVVIGTFYGYCTRPALNKKYDVLLDKKKEYMKRQENAFVTKQKSYIAQFKNYLKSAGNADIVLVEPPISLEAFKKLYTIINELDNLKEILDRRTFTQNQKVVLERFGQVYTTCLGKIVIAAKYAVDLMKGPNELKYKELETILEQLSAVIEKYKVSISELSESMQTSSLAELTKKLDDSIDKVKQTMEIMNATPVSAEVLAFQKLLKMTPEFNENTVLGNKEVEKC